MYNSKVQYINADRSKVLEAAELYTSDLSGRYVLLTITRRIKNVKYIVERKNCHRSP